MTNTLATLLSRQRLVTIAGPGGAGKTTLARLIAKRLERSYGHGACFVDLAVVTDEGLIYSALATQIGLPEDGTDPLLACVERIRNESLLLVLDNCEHVIDAAAHLAELVLRRAPGVQLLVTSREPLRAAAEYVYRLQPLEAPPEYCKNITPVEALTFPAIQLFSERAKAHLDTFELVDADIAAAAEICRRLDGNPLAIEWAAAQMSVMSVQELAARLDDSLQVLTRGHRLAPLRHQTLRASLEWSYRLLTPAEKIVLRRLSVFPDSFDMECAHAAAADEAIHVTDVFECIAGLVAKSLVVADVMGERSTFRLLGTVRLYALEMLAACDEAAHIQARYATIAASDGPQMSRRRH